MSDHEAMRELLEIDPRESFLARELAGFEHPEVKATEAPVCILCESGYHDHAWEVTHIMKCGCPCHEKRSSATHAG